MKDAPWPEPPCGCETPDPGPQPSSRSEGAPEAAAEPPTIQPGAGYTRAQLAKLLTHRLTELLTVIVARCELLQALDMDIPANDQLHAIKTAAVAAAEVNVRIFTLAHDCEKAHG